MTALTIPNIEAELDAMHDQLSALKAVRGWSKMTDQDLRSRLEPIAKAEAKARALAGLMRLDYCPFIDSERWHAMFTIPRQGFRKYWNLIAEILDEREAETRPAGVGLIVRPWEA